MDKSKLIESLKGKYSDKNMVFGGSRVGKSSFAAHVEQLKAYKWDERDEIVPADEVQLAIDKAVEAMRGDS